MLNSTIKEKNSLLENSLLEKVKTKGVKGEIPLVKTKDCKVPCYKGKIAGCENNKKYHWYIIMFDKETGQMKEGKYTTIKKLNEDLGLKLNTDYVKRIMTHYRTDEKMRNKENSFLARWGHIKINKINEPIREIARTQ